MKRFLKLYKVVNGEHRLVDYGVASQIDNYRKQGYKMVWSRHHSPVYKVLKEEFDSLWAYLPVSEKVRLHDVAVDQEMSIEERLMLLKAEIVRRPKRTIVVTHRIRAAKKVSLWATIKDKVQEFVDSTIFQPAFAFGHF